MDYFDFRPRSSPIIDCVSYRYSVGAYRGKNRIVIAWFADEASAEDYLTRCRLERPYIKFDCLQSLF